MRPRLDHPDCIHHVYARGIDKRAILRTDEDKRNLLTHLSDHLMTSGARVLTWDLQINHYHLVVRSGTEPISNGLRVVQARFAREYNERNGRTGYVFQGRFQSRVVESDAYLRQLIAYVHLNPLDAGDVASIEDLERYPWCGFGALMGSRAVAPFHDVPSALAIFGDTVASARLNLVAGMRELYGEGLRGIREFEAELSRRTRDDEPLGGVLAIGCDPTRAAELSERMRARSSRRALLHRAGWTLGNLIDRVCAATGADGHAVRSGRRCQPEARARAVVAHVGCDLVGEPAIEVARATGVSASAIALARSRGKRICQESSLRARDLLPAGFGIAADA